MPLNTINKYIKKYIWYALGAMILVLWAFVHIYRLGQVPTGLHIDEAGMAYDAFCVLNWGVDRYLNPYPLYFYNLGGGQSAMYVYLCAICIKLFGMSTWVFRIPAVVFSFIGLVFSTLIVNMSLGKKAAYLNAFLFCILPYYIMMSRFGLDCNLMFGVGCFATWFSLYTLKKDKIWLYILCGIVWGISLYTYVLSYIVFPVVILILLVYFYKSKTYSGYVKKIKKSLCLLLPMIIVSIPLIAMTIINVFDLPTIKTSFFTIYRLQNERAEELSIISIPKNIFTVLKMVFTTDGTPFDAAEKFGTIYYLSIPIFVIGLFYCILRVILSKSDRNEINTLMLTFFGIELLLGASKSNVAIYNLNAIYLPVLYFIIYGFTAIKDIIKVILSIKSEDLMKRMRFSYLIFYSVLTIFGVCYIVEFVEFEKYYLNEYPNSIASNYLFSDRLNEVLDVFDTSISTYPAYVDAYYLYYMLEKRVNPYDVNITDDYSKYNNITFSSMETTLPAKDKIEDYGIYVINRWNVNDIAILSQYPYDRFWAEKYVVFYK